MKKEKKYNYKFLVGIVMGIIASSIVVVYATAYAANIVYYNNVNRTLSSNNVQGAIDELATRFTPYTSCPSNYVCEPFKTTLAVGDYITYTPNKTSYTTNTSTTGYTSAQTINPSELNLWRVLKINDNETVEIISEYVSSNKVCFFGKIGYQNYIGYLNVIASQYENSTYTSGSRAFDYSGTQTEYISNSSLFTIPPPWTCSTNGSCSPAPVESQGGGDYSYSAVDFQLISSVASLSTVIVGTNVTATYWDASRYYRYDSESVYSWEVMGISNGRYTNKLVKYESGSLVEQGACRYIRPIVILKSGLSYYGYGTLKYPMEIQ